MQKECNSRFAKWFDRLILCLHLFNLFAVCLQPFDFDPNEKNRHKFMVQSVVAPDGDFNAEQLVSSSIHSIQTGKF